MDSSCTRGRPRSRVKNRAETSGDANARVVRIIILYAHVTALYVSRMYVGKHASHKIINDFKPIVTRYRCRRPSGRGLKARTAPHRRVPHKKKSRRRDRNGVRRSKTAMRIRTGRPVLAAAGRGVTVSRGSRSQTSRVPGRFDGAEDLPARDLYVFRSFFFPPRRSSLRSFRRLYRDSYTLIICYPLSR